MVDHQPDLVLMDVKMPVMTAWRLGQDEGDLSGATGADDDSLRMRKKFLSCWSWSGGLPGEAFGFKPAAPVCGDTNRQFREKILSQILFQELKPIIDGFLLCLSYQVNLHKGRGNHVRMASPDVGGN